MPSEELKGFTMLRNEKKSFQLAVESECDFDYIEDDVKIDDYEFLTHDGSMELGKYEEYVDACLKYYRLDEKEIEETKT